MSTVSPLSSSACPPNAGSGIASPLNPVLATLRPSNNSSSSNSPTPNVSSVNGVPTNNSSRKVPEILHESNGKLYRIWFTVTINGTEQTINVPENLLKNHATQLETKGLLTPGCNLDLHLETVNGIECLCDKSGIQNVGPELIDSHKAITQIIRAELLNQQPTPPSSSQNPGAANTPASVVGTLSSSLSAVAPTPTLHVVGNPSASSTLTTTTTSTTSSSYPTPTLIPPPPSPSNASSTTNSHTSVATTSVSSTSTTPIITSSSSSPTSMAATPAASHTASTTQHEGSQQPQEPIPPPSLLRKAASAVTSFLVYNAQPLPTTDLTV